MECHGNVMEFYLSGNVMEMSWNSVKMSWKKGLFANLLLRNFLKASFLEYEKYLLKILARAFGAHI